MSDAGSFSCSNNDLQKLFCNIKWGMRSNFLSIPTDSPQRDGRLGWTGDIALFTPTATFLYDCFGIMKNWLTDLDFEQEQLGGVPPMVCPNALSYHKAWGNIWPMAVWDDVTVLAPWALWEETGDLSILSLQYRSMASWIKSIPRGKTTSKHLWDPENFQLGVSFYVLLTLLHASTD